jgi:hypothetical protein
MASLATKPSHWGTSKPELFNRLFMTGDFVLIRRRKGIDHLKGVTHYLSDWHHVKGISLFSILQSKSMARKHTFSEIEQINSKARLQMKLALSEVRPGEGIEISRSGKRFPVASVFQMLVGDKRTYRRKMNLLLRDAVSSLRYGQTLKIIKTK